MEPHGRSKGRSRGKAKQPATSEVGGAAAAKPTQQPQQSRATARGERPGGLQASSSVKQVTAAMGAMKGLGAGGNNSNNGNNNGGNNGGKTTVGRGTMRGNREIVPAQIVWTKPAAISSKKGLSGEVVSLITNYFQVYKSKNWMLCQYQVDLKPPIDHTGIKKKLMRNHNDFLKCAYLYDGSSLFMVRKLPNQVTELKGKDQGDEPYQFSLTLIKEVNPYDSQFIQILNIFFRRCQEHLGMKELGRNYYQPKLQMREEQYKITVWPGFTTSIRHHEQNILLNLDVSHKLLRDETLYEAMKRNHQNRRPFDEFLGSIVMTTYNDKTYRIDDFDMKCTPLSTFLWRGSQTSYVDYYKEKYQVQIKDVKQPMVISKPKARDIRRGMDTNIVLVPELCIMTGLPENLRNDYRVMNDMAKYMRVAPDRRVQTLIKFNRELQQTQKVIEEMNKWGLTFEKELTKVQGRILPEEAILQGGLTIKYNRFKSEWSSETRSARLNTPVKILNWAIICPSNCEGDAKEFVSTLKRVAEPMGMELKVPPNAFFIQRDGISDYINAISQCQGMQMVLLVLPNNKVDRYGAIKKHLSCNMAIPSQCVLLRTISNKKRLMSVATKVAIQMNCKMGGDVWNVAVPMKGVMVIGYDTYHDSIKKSDSYGATVCSYNHNWTKYYGQVQRHRDQAELSSNFAVCVKRAIEHYKIANNGAVPSKVIVFRDGVGDGQIAYVKEHEIGAIKETFAALGMNPQFGFIIVSKRINTRIFSDPGPNRPPGNPLPGTVVDDVITLPERYDFFLVSQSVTQGTVSPTSFNIIEDTTGLKPDHIQRFAYKLTHLYYNWQGTVRVPAPCLYAHKLAYLTGTAIHECPHPTMADRLWYL